MGHLTSVTHSASLSKQPAMWASCLITSTCEAEATLGICGASFHEVGPAGSKTWGVLKVLPPEGSGTTLSVAIMKQQESRRGSLT